jgi:hypothetical protein
VSATTIGAGTSAYTNIGIMQGVSAMAMMTDGTVLVAMAAPAFNLVERFEYNTTTNTLSRAAGSTFIPTDAFTKSISALLVANATL